MVIEDRGIDPAGGLKEGIQGKPKDGYGGSDRNGFRWRIYGIDIWENQRMDMEEQWIDSVGESKESDPRKPMMVMEDLGSGFKEPKG